MPSLEARATKERIQRAARQCFAARGFARTSLRDIATLAGVTPPLVSHYFGNKRAVFDAVLHSAVENYSDARRGRWADDPGVLRFFVEGVFDLFRWMQQQKDLSRLMMWARLEELPITFPTSDPMRERAIAHFAEGMRQGILRDSLRPEVVLTLADAFIKGYWERRDLYLIGLNDDEHTRFDEVMERAVLLSMLQAFITPPHLPDAVRLLDELLGTQA